MSDNLLMETDIAVVFARLKKALGITTDVALSRRLGVTASYVYSCRSTNSVPYKPIVQLAVRYAIDLRDIFEE